MKGCKLTRDGEHCLFDTISPSMMICCQCGEALPPWHPDIEWLCKEGRL